MLGEYEDSVTADNEGPEYRFIESVIWADDSKRRGGGFQRTWHYDSQPWIGDDSEESALKIDYDSRNVSSALHSIYKWLKTGEVGTDDEIVEKIRDFKYCAGNEKAAKSLALRLLMHYVGDIHQPLHCLTRYTADDVDGDAGGNGFPLKYRYRVNKLHGLWDNGIYKYRKSFSRPLSAESNAALGEFAQELNDNFQFTNQDVRTDDFDLWRRESYSIAHLAYQGLTPNGPVPKDYIDKFLPVAQLRVSLAGHRLAYIIEQIFG